MEVLTMNREGGLEKIEPVKELPIGMRVYGFGAGMCEQYYCITGPMTSKGQQMCLTSNWYPDSYFSTPRHDFDKYSRPLSKKFGIGFYWDDVENYIYPESKVKAAIRRADIIERKIAQREQAQRLADEKQIKELPSQYPHLTPLKKEGGYDYMALRSNILAELKHRFPCTKFSIKKRGYGSIYIAWKDGPTDDMVREVKSIFVDHVTDYTGDYRDYEPTNFNRIFGGINYISTQRQMSDEVLTLTFQIEKDLNVPDYEARNMLRQSWWNVEIPKSATNFRIEKRENAWKDEGMYELLFDIKAPVTVDLQVTIGDIEIVNYSPKSFAVYGNTKPIKDKLKELGGCFNMRLKATHGFTDRKSVV